MFSFDHLITLLRDYWDVFLLEGLRYTLILSAIAVFFGAIFGSLLAFGRLSNSKILRFLCAAYTEVVRDTPLLVQLYFFVLLMPKLFSGLFTLSVFQATAMAFAFNSAAYVSEIVRSGIQAVDAGQTEAARSLGMNARQTMLRVVMPQAVKNILPALCNEFISTVKGTSLASVFFVGELMTSFKTVQSATFLALQSLTIVGIIYFLLNFILSRLLRVIERRLTVSD